MLAAFKNGEKPKPGPQSGRHTSENSAGLTALTEKVPSSIRNASHVVLNARSLLRSLMVLESIANLSLLRVHVSGSYPGGVQCKAMFHTSLDRWQTHVITYNGGVYKCVLGGRGGKDFGSTKGVDTGSWCKGIQ